MIMFYLYVFQFALGNSTSFQFRHQRMSGKTGLAGRVGLDFTSDYFADTDDHVSASENRHFIKCLIRYLHLHRFKLIFVKDKFMIFKLSVSSLLDRSSLY